MNDLVLDSAMLLILKINVVSENKMVFSFCAEGIKEKLLTT
jgi:hypothetical protein